jgi:hypothetical protein
MVSNEHLLAEVYGYSGGKINCRRRKFCPFLESIVRKCFHLIRTTLCVYLSKITTMVNRFLVKICDEN